MVLQRLRRKGETISFEHGSCSTDGKRVSEQQPSLGHEADQIGFIHVLGKRLGWNRDVVKAKLEGTTTKCSASALIEEMQRLCEEQQLPSQPRRDG